MSRRLLLLVLLAMDVGLVVCDDDGCCCCGVVENDAFAIGVIIGVFLFFLVNDDNVLISFMVVICISVLFL